MTESDIRHVLCTIQSHLSRNAPALAMLALADFIVAKMSFEDIGEGEPVAALGSFGVPVQAINALEGAGYREIAMIRRQTDAKLAKIANIGKTHIGQIRAAIQRIDEIRESRLAPHI